MSAWINPVFGKDLYHAFNSYFIVKFVMRVLNKIQVSVSGYFLAEEIVSYFEVKKWSYMLRCEVVGSRNRLSTAKSGIRCKAI